MGDLTPLLPRAFKTARHERSKAAKRRDRLTAAGFCLNGPGHGPATHGRRCDRCFHVYKHGYAKALELGLIAHRPRCPAQRVTSGLLPPAEDGVGSK